MNLILTDIERELLRQSIMDTIVNSPNFNSIERDYLTDIYHKIKDYEEDTPVDFTRYKININRK